jgi:hypothetical protein
MDLISENWLRIRGLDRFGIGSDSNESLIRELKWDFEVRFSNANPHEPFKISISCTGHFSPSIAFGLLVDTVGVDFQL